MSLRHWQCWCEFALTVHGVMRWQVRKTTLLKGRKPSRKVTLRDPAVSEGALLIGGLG